MMSAILFFFFLYHLYWVSFRLMVHGQAHRVWKLSPILEHICRFLQWLTFGNSWNGGWLQLLVAQHRIHHRDADTPNDLISPHVFTLKELFKGIKDVVPGRPFYISPEDIATYGSDFKIYDDWLENNVYRHRWMGMNILWIIYTLLFGIPGFLVGGFHRFYITYFNIWVSLYLYHKIGYRKKGYDGSDQSRNIFPIGILFAGEELHGNHHTTPYLKNYAIRWYEFDIGYWYAKFFKFIGLLEFKDKNN